MTPRLTRENTPAQKRGNPDVKRRDLGGHEGRWPRWRGDRTPRRAIPGIRRFKSCPLHVDFWEQHRKAEEAHAAEERAKAPPSVVNAPQQCQQCGVVDPDVFFGLCGPCSEERQG